VAPAGVDAPEQLLPATNRSLLNCWQRLLDVGRELEGLCRKNDGWRCLLMTRLRQNKIKKHSACEPPLIIYHATHAMQTQSAANLAVQEGLAYLVVHAIGVLFSDTMMSCFTRHDKEVPAPMQGSRDLEPFPPTCVSSLESDVNEDVDVQFKGAHSHQVGIIITQQSTG